MAFLLKLVFGSCARLWSETVSFTFVSCTKEAPVLPRLFEDFWLFRFTDKVKVSWYSFGKCSFTNRLRKVSEDKRGTEKCECLDFSSKLLWMLISCVKLCFGDFVQQSCAIDVVTCRQTFTNGLQPSRPWIEGVRREEHSWFVWRCLPMQAIAIACKLDHCLTCINQWKLVIR